MSVDHSQGEELGRGLDPDGKELVLRRQEGGFVITADGQVALASASRRSDEELVRLGLGPLRDRTDITVLLAGLGMGHILRVLLQDPRVIRVDVVEHCEPLITWNQDVLQVLHAEPPLADPRVHLHKMGFTDYLRRLQAGEPGLGPTTEDGTVGWFWSVILDLDEGPSKLSRGGNAELYEETGLDLIEGALRPGGVLCLWSTEREQELLLRSKGRFQNVAEMLVPGDLGMDYIYRFRRGALPKPASSQNGHN